MKKFNLYVLVSIMVLFCIACKNDTGNSKINESTDSTKNIEEQAQGEDKELSFNKLIMTVMYNYPESENSDVRYFLSVMNDGSIYAMTYTDEEIGFGSDFFGKLYSCDNDAWNYVENVELLGMLSEEKILLINEKIEKIDNKSEYFDVDKDFNGMGPQGIETASYAIYCYITSEDRCKASFKVTEGGLFNGMSYKTYDESANAILDAVEGDEIYVEWKKQHMSNMYDSQPDWGNE